MQVRTSTVRWIVAASVIATAGLVLWVNANAPRTAPQAEYDGHALHEQVAHLQQEHEALQELVHDMQEQQQRALVHGPQLLNEQVPTTSAKTKHGTTTTTTMLQDCNAIWMFDILTSNSESYFTDARKNGNVTQTNFHGLSCSLPYCAGYACANHGGKGERIVVTFVHDGLTNFFNLLKGRTNCNLLQKMLYGFRVNGLWVKNEGACQGAGHVDNKDVYEKRGLPLFYILAWVMIIQWHVRFRFLNVLLARWFKTPIYRVKAMRGARKLGLNILVVFQYFGPYDTHILPGKAPFNSTVFVIILDTFVLFYLFAPCSIKASTQFKTNHEVLVRENSFGKACLDKKLEKSGPYKIKEFLTVTEDGVSKVILEDKKDGKQLQVETSRLIIVPKEFQDDESHDQDLLKDDRKKTAALEQYNRELLVKQIATRGEQNEDDGYTDDKDTATNVYEDLTVVLRKVIPVFFCQLALVSFYIEELNSGTNAAGDASNTTIGDGIKDTQKVDAWFWFVGIIFQMFASESELGTNFTAGLWSKFLAAGFGESLKNLPGMKRHLDNLKADDVDFGHRLMESMKQILDVGTTHKVFFWIPLSQRYEMLMRITMDFIVNGIARALIMYTFPIILCVEGPLDFVKDCTAVLFIAHLDDLDEDTPFQAITSIMKIKEILQTSSSYDLEGEDAKLERHTTRQKFAEEGKQGIDNPSGKIRLNAYEREYVTENSDKFDQYKKQWDEMCKIHHQKEWHEWIKTETTDKNGKPI